MYRCGKAPEIENLIKTIEQLSIDPVYDTNWNDMPDDIKWECIRKMELKERLSLRCTAKAERSLVDSQKINFTDGHFRENDYDLGFDLYRDNKYYFSICSRLTSEFFKSIKYIKRIGVFENLTISVKNPLANNEQFMTDDELFTAKNIEFYMRGSDVVVPVLRKMKNGVESIKIDNGLLDELGQILAIPIVQNVPYWHIQKYDQANSLHMVAQMWIDKNARIGSIFQVSVSKDGSSAEFLKQFDDRIVSKSEKRVRIRTNDPDRHILMERGVDDVFTINYINQFFRLIVISSEMKESEYDDNCKEWICKIDPGMQNMYDVYDILGYEEHNNYDAVDDFGAFGRQDNDDSWDYEDYDDW
ncbi:hypothetical protein B9Z55_012914 [Caenorhabditis nigoni]|uniref:F-box domain-containing protein n=1 Tax=Caenorhabditis nigoni TaxID=1611254 RepID=A0A2G5TZF8_9PELO|nr:hypothetical protein B9Z55_012914 [Caenorhabditis nigoni]